MRLGQPAKHKRRAHKHPAVFEAQQEERRDVLTGGGVPLAPEPSLEQTRSGHLLGKFRADQGTFSQGKTQRPAKKEQTQETTKDPKVEGSRSYQSRQLLSSGARKLPKHLFFCVLVQSERGGWSVTDLCWLLEPSTFGSFVVSWQTRPNLYPLAGDDRALTLLKRGCANSGGFGARWKTPWVEQACSDCPGFLVSGAGDAPTSRASSSSLGLCFWTSICFHGPSSEFLDLLPPASLLPVQKRDAQHKFLQHKHTDFREFPKSETVIPKLVPKWF